MTIDRRLSDFPSRARHASKNDLSGLPNSVTEPPIWENLAAIAPGPSSILPSKNPIVSALLHNIGKPFSAAVANIGSYVFQPIESLQPERRIISASSILVTNELHFNLSL